MAKDYINSYEQACWNQAVRTHTNYVNMLKTFTHEGPMLHVNKRIKELEDKYPQLKSKGN